MFSHDIHQSQGSCNIILIIFPGFLYRFPYCFKPCKMDTGINALFLENSVQRIPVKNICLIKGNRGGKGITFATGTPISNSMTELYVMQRYLQNSKLQNMGLGLFDSWASTFGEVVTSIELAPGSL